MTYLMCRREDLHALQGKNRLGRCIPCVLFAQFVIRMCSFLRVGVLDVIESLAESLCPQLIGSELDHKLHVLCIGDAVAVFKEVGRTLARWFHVSDVLVVQLLASFGRQSNHQGECHALAF